MSDPGQEMHTLCRELFPICRSITGNGFRQSLEILKKHLKSRREQIVLTGLFLKNGISMMPISSTLTVIKSVASKTLIYM